MFYLLIKRLPCFRLWNSNFNLKLRHLIHIMIGTFQWLFFIYPLLTKADHRAVLSIYTLGRHWSSPKISEFESPTFGLENYDSWYNSFTQTPKNPLMGPKFSITLQLIHHSIWLSIILWIESLSWKAFTIQVAPLGISNNNLYFKSEWSIMKKLRSSKGIKKKIRFNRSQLLYWSKILIKWNQQKKSRTWLQLQSHRIC